MHVQRRASWPVKNAQALSAEMAQTLRVLSARRERDRGRERQRERGRERERERETRQWAKMSVVWINGEDWRKGAAVVREQNI